MSDEDYSNDQHGEPRDDVDCAICFCPMDNESYCEYKSHVEETKWKPAGLCLYCIQHLQETQWDKHLEDVKKVDCRRAAIEICRNVPLYVHERTVFVCEEHGEDCQLRGSIQLLWSKVDNSVTVPLLKGAKLGKDREEYIEYLEGFADLFEAEREEDIKKVEEGQKKQ